MLSSEQEGEYTVKDLVRGALAVGSCLGAEGQWLEVWIGTGRVPGDE